MLRKKYYKSFHGWCRPYDSGHLCWIAKDAGLVRSWRYRLVKLRPTTPRSEWLDWNNWLPRPSYNTSVHRFIYNDWECNTAQSHIPFFSNFKTSTYEIYPRLVLFGLVILSNYIELSQVYYYLLPTKRLQSAVRDLAKTGDGRRAAWSFSHDLSPPQNCSFPFCYTISNTREQKVKHKQMEKV